MKIKPDTHTHTHTQTHTHAHTHTHMHTHAHTHASLYLICCRFDGRAGEAWDTDPWQGPDSTWGEPSNLPDTIITNQTSFQADLPAPEVCHCCVTRGNSVIFIAHNAQPHTFTTIVICLDTNVTLTQLDVFKI